MANLRIIHNNIADTATITATASAVGYSINNLKNDTKGTVWRSTSLTTTVITLTWAANQSMQSVVLPFTNLSSSATVRVVCKNSVPAVLYDSTTIQATPYTLSNWASSAAYSYGGGTAVRVYLPTLLTTIRSVEISITDAGNTQGYMEVSRIICGEYWSPKYNTSFGLSIGYLDRSQHSRSQAGNTITDIGTVSKALSFDLGYLDTTDRNILIQLLRQVGLRKALFISLFPEDADVEKEYQYMIYGKLTQLATIVHPMYSQYTSTISIEEV